MLDAIKSSSYFIILKESYIISQVTDLCTIHITHRKDMNSIVNCKTVRRVCLYGFSSRDVSNSQSVSRKRTNEQLLIVGDGFSR